jgi:hypothetical protein
MALAAPPWKVHARPFVDLRVVLNARLRCDALTLRNTSSMVVIVNRKSEFETT